MKDDVVMISETIGERKIWRYPALRATEKFITDSYANAGYEPITETFEAKAYQVSNVIAELVGTGTTKKNEIIVIGAHYDSAVGTPGANDNASAVAGLLELARLLKDTKLNRTIRFGAFVNEEPPFTFTKHMGSKVYAAGAINEMTISLQCFVSNVLASIQMCREVNRIHLH